MNAQFLSYGVMSPHCNVNNRGVAEGEVSKMGTTGLPVGLHSTSKVNIYSVKNNTKISTIKLFSNFEISATAGRACGRGTTVGG
jgi:hypothetical protein